MQNNEGPPTSPVDDQRNQIAEELLHDNLSWLVGTRQGDVHLATIRLVQPGVDGNAPEVPVGFDLEGPCDDVNRSMLNRLYLLAKVDPEQTTVEQIDDEEPTTITTLRSPYTIIREHEKKVDGKVKKFWVSAHPTEIDEYLKEQSERRRAA